MRAVALALYTALLAESLQHENKSEIFARSLRKQLMQHNYDYMSAEGAAAGEEPAVGKGPSADDQPPTDTHPYQKHITKDNDTNILATQGQEGENRSHSEMKSIYRDSNQTRRRLRSRKSRKWKRRRREYLHDINEDVAMRYRGRKRKGGARSGALRRGGAPTSPRRYKVLKVRKQYRRSGAADALVLEESPGAVAVVKLGAGPFPEFRLPAARRQYMRAPQPLHEPPASSAAQPPPPLPGEPAASSAAQPPSPPPGEAPASSAAQLSPLDDPPSSRSTQLPDHSSDEDLSSLKITVTPDEIFVL